MGKTMGLFATDVAPEICEGFPQSQNAAIVGRILRARQPGPLQAFYRSMWNLQQVHNTLILIVLLQSYQQQHHCHHYPDIAPLLWCLGAIESE